VNAVSDEEKAAKFFAGFTPWVIERAAPPEPKPVSDDVVYSVEERKKPAVRCVWCGWRTDPFESQQQYEEILWPSMQKHVARDCPSAPHMKMAAEITDLESRLAAQGREIEEARELFSDCIAAGPGDHRERIESWRSRNKPQEVKDGK
jgi:hypothetical protein